jgi:hypothetical protein
MFRPGRGADFVRRQFNAWIRSAQAGTSQAAGISLTRARGFEDMKGDLHLHGGCSRRNGNALFGFDQDSFQQRKRVWIEIRSDLLCHFVSFGWFDREMLEASGYAEIAGM